MKFILKILTLFIIILTFASCTQTCDCFDLKEVNGKFYEKTSNEPFTVTCISEIYGVKKEIHYKIPK